MNRTPNPSPRRVGAHPFAVMRNLLAHRALLRQLTQREIRGRYEGAVFGLLWSLITPLVMLAVYTLVFGVIFKARWPEARTDSLGEVALTLFCGLTVFRVFSECIERAPRLILEHRTYVKKVVFPLEILPLVVMSGSLFHAAVNLLVVAGGSLLVFHTIPVTLLLVPLVLIPVCLITLAGCWLLSALGVFFRDLQQLVRLLVPILFFTTPIFYSSHLVPDRFRPWLHLNPLAGAVDGLRRVALWGMVPEWPYLALWTGIGLAMALGCYSVFMRLRPGFSDVL